MEELYEGLLVLCTVTAGGDWKHLAHMGSVLMSTVSYYFIMKPTTSLALWSCLTFKILWYSGFSLQLDLIWEQWWIVKFNALQRYCVGPVGIYYQSILICLHLIRFTCSNNLFCVILSGMRVLFDLVLVETKLGHYAPFHRCHSFNMQFGFKSQDLKRRHPF